MTNNNTKQNVRRHKHVHKRTRTHTFLLVRISQRSGVLFLGHAGTDQVTGDNIWCLLGELCVYICTNNTLIPPRVLQRGLLCVCLWAKED